MKRLIFTVFMGAAAASIAWGAVITPGQALERVAGNSVLRPGVMRNGQAQPRLAETRSIDGQPAVYVYEMAGGQGFMVLSADDMAMPLLGYSNEGSFSASDINPEMRWWLDEYAKEIKWMRENQEASGRRLSSPKAEREPIAPLLKTKWNQGAPYNNMCPRESDGSRCVTGCVATAMAQIVNYHRLPAGNGTGTASVTCDGKVYSFDFENETFDWDNMLDVYGGKGSYTQTEADAVAKLMFACGVSVDMDYGPNESGAVNDNVAYALTDHFGFDKGVVIARRNWFGLEEWNDYIYAQLRDYGPVQYSGRNDGSGHSFVCDGYDRDGFFHINWGWGGMSNGYFRLTALDPDTQGIGGSVSGYNLNQSVVSNICPPREDSQVTYVMYMDGELSVADGSGYPIDNVGLGNTFYLAGGFFNGSIADGDIEFAYKLEPADGGQATYKNIYTNPVSLRPNYGFNTLPVALPSSLSKGEYRLYPVWRLEGSDEWREYRIPVTSARYVSVSVSGSTASIAVAEAPLLEAEVTSWDTPCFVGKPIGVSVRLKNPSSDEFLGCVASLLIDYYGNPIARGSLQAVDLQGGETTDIAYSSAFVRIDDNPYIAPGKYTYVLCEVLNNNSFRIISEEYDIILKSAPVGQGKLSCDRFTLAGDSHAADNMALHFNAHITCTSGYYIGEVVAWIYEEGESAPVGRLYSGTQYISEGTSADVAFAGAVPDLEARHTYRARLHDGNGWIKNGDSYAPTVVFTVGDPSGVIGIETNEVLSREFYTLSGTKVSETDLAPGLYIVRERLADGTIRVTKEFRR